MLAFDLILEIYQAPPLETFKPESETPSAGCINMLYNAIFGGGRTKPGAKKKQVQKILRQKALLPLQKHLMGGSFEK